MVRACVRLFTLSNMNISATSWPIGMKFYLENHWGGGKASVRFDPDLVRTLVSMATDSSHRADVVRACARLFTLSNMNISATSWPIGMKFYLENHWGGGKASVRFDPDLFRTLVSMATDSSHRVIMGKTASSCFLECF